MNMSGIFLNKLLFFMLEVEDVAKTATPSQIKIEKLFTIHSFVQLMVVL